LTIFAIVGFSIFVVVGGWFSFGFLSQPEPDQEGSDAATCECEGPDLVCSDGEITENAAECVSEGAAPTCECVGANLECSDGTITADAPECAQEGPTEPVCGNGTLEEGEACEPGGSECGANEECNASTCQCESTGTVTANATASSDLNVRADPGPGCDVLPSVNTQTLILDAKSSTEPVWYRIQGGGWVFGGALNDLNYQFVGDPATLPVDDDAVGCLFCGDGVCSSEIDESAPTCEADCPAVCGDNFVTHDEACDPPESEPADPAYGEPAVEWCNASCQFSSKEPPAEPPFDSSACYAACAEDSDCPAGFTCNPDSQCFIAQCAD
jgi:hypothetical protein